MAKTKMKSHFRSKSSSKPDSILHSTDAHVKSKITGTSRHSGRTIEDLLTEAASLLEQGQPELALPFAEEALTRLEAERNDNENQNTIDTYLRLAAQDKITLPSALSVKAEVHLALGDEVAARRSFEAVVNIDPKGALVSADPWLWLAQLSQKGGMESIGFFERGCGILRGEIAVLEKGLEDTLNEEAHEGGEEGRLVLEERKAKLADALCGMAEVYMTDLSWEEDAEAKCEAYVTEAVAVCPEIMSASCLQTLASVRISQNRLEDARKALSRSLGIWRDIPPEVEAEARPDFATRVSLARLLMEVEVEVEAMGVLEGLVKEDDESVECLYLGGWCQVLMSGKEGLGQEEKRKLQEQAKEWLDNCLRLFKVQDYEDDRLKDHTVELLERLNKVLGIEDDKGGWEDEDEDGQADDNDDDELEVNGYDEDEDVEMT